MIDAKVKRNEMLEQHLAEGDDYVENLKIRHLKNVIAKNISYNMMEKKLYLERLNNWILYFRAKCINFHL